MSNLEYSFYSLVWIFMVTDSFPDNLEVSQQTKFFFFIIQTVTYLYNNIHKKQRKIYKKSIVPWEITEISYKSFELLFLKGWVESRKDFLNYYFNKQSKTAS